MGESSAKSFAHGGTVPVRSHKTCVAYDSNNGRIHRVHHFITLEGGREPSDQEVGNQAISLLAERGIHGPHLKVLHIEPETIHALTVYTVDLKNLKLIEKQRSEKKAPNPDRLCERPLKPRGNVS